MPRKNQGRKKTANKRMKMKPKMRKSKNSRKKSRRKSKKMSGGAEINKSSPPWMSGFHELMKNNKTRDWSTRNPGFQNALGNVANKQRLNPAETEAFLEQNKEAIDGFFRSINFETDNTIPYTLPTINFIDDLIKHLETKLEGGRTFDFTFKSIFNEKYPTFSSTNEASKYIKRLKDEGKLDNFFYALQHEPDNELIVGLDKTKPIDSLIQYLKNIGQYTYIYKPLLNYLIKTNNINIVPKKKE